MAKHNIAILLVEDNPVYTRLIQKLLAKSESPAYEVISAETLSDAIEILARERIDLVLLDLMLPDSQVLDTFFRIKV